MRNFYKYALFIIAPCAMFQPLAMDIFISGLPKMISQLQISEKSVQYFLGSFVLATGVPQLFIGHYVDRYGRRPLMLLGSMSFALCSFLCTLSNNIHLLSVFRFMQGLSSSATLVVCYAIIRDISSGRESSKKFSQLSCALAVTPMLAPMLGTILMALFQVWQSTFWFLFAFSIVALIGVYFLVPETKPSSSPIETNNKKGLSFIKIILSNQTFLTYCLSATTTMTGLYIYFSIGSLLLMDRLHLSSVVYSILFGMNGITYLLANYTSSELVKSKSLSSLVMMGNALIFMGASLMLLLTLAFGLNAFCIVTTNLLITMGGGLMTGPATSAALEPFPENTGLASGVFGAVQYGLPAVIVFVVTRFEISTTASIAVPLLFMATFNLLLHQRRAKREIVGA